MKGMKGKMLKKLKSVKSIGYLNPDRILQVSSLDNFVDNLNLKSTFAENFPFKSHMKSHLSSELNSKKPEKPKKIDVDQLMKEIVEEEVDQEMQLETDIDDKENVIPSDLKNSAFLANEVEKSSSCCPDFERKVENDSIENVVLAESEVSSFKRPDMGSWTLFDPNLLAAFQQAVSLHIQSCEAEEKKKACEKKQKYPFFQPEEQSDPSTEFDDQTDPLLEFEEKCPPGGSDSVIFYTTSLRGIRKTFEDCQSIRFLLESFGVIFYERDVSVHLEFRDELWCIMGEKALPPRLFIRGRYIGGADRVLTLHEQGRLRVLFRDIPIDFSEGPCHVCCGLRFILCYNCNGSRKLFEQDDQGCGNNGGLWSKCLQCNENGLIVCPLC